MNRELRLRLTFEGTGSGLEKGRLSIDSFAPAFIELQRAFRRIAQGYVTAATRGSPEYVDAPFGKFSDAVKELSLEIDAISHNSPPCIDLVCPIPEVAVGATWPMFMEHTVDRAADELLSAIESESKGNPRNAFVRAYLATLPTGVSRQSVDLQKLDGSHREIVLGAYELATLSREYPYFVHQTARVGGVAFAPLPPEVRFSGDGAATHAAADENQVEQALAHRGEAMTGLFVRKGKVVRAIWLEPGSVPLEPPSRVKRDAHFARRWASALQLLAE
jgi:hypothetical protein